MTARAGREATSVEAPTPSASNASLGSLTQPGARAAIACRACSSARVTHIGMELADGSEVEFVHCLDCEHRSWEHAGDVVDVDVVLTKTRRAR